MEVWCDGAYGSQLCCLASHYSYQIDTYVPLLPQIWRLDLHLFNIGREHPPSTAASAVPTVINEALLLPRPRHRSTAMCFFASNIAQRLVIRRQLIDSYFFSSMLFGEELGRPQWGLCCWYERTGGHGDFREIFQLWGFLQRALFRTIDVPRKELVPYS